MILDFIAQQDYTLLERRSWLARCSHSVALSCSFFVHKMGASVPHSRLLGRLSDNLP